MDIEGIFLKIGAKFDDVYAALQNAENVVASQMQGLSSKLEGIGKGMSKALTLPITALSGLSLNTFGNFEATMNKVGALAEATADQMSLLSKSAMKMGADTQFSSQQAADGMESFAAQGFSVKQIMDAMPGTLALAAAGQLKLGDAAEKSAGILKGFNLDASKVGDVANIIAAAANKSAASVSDLASSFKYIGPVASAVGMSLGETAAALAILADAGIKGESGGTAIRSMLSSLLNPSKKAAEAMSELGISVKDATGKLLPMSQIIDRLGPLTSHVETGFAIFGKRFSDVLPLLKAGSKGFDELSLAMKNASANKEAEKMAERLFKGWNASLEQFKGSLETLGVAFGKVLSGPVGQLLNTVLTPLVNVITQAVEAFGQLPAPIQTAGVAFVGLVAAAGPALLAIGKFIEVQQKLAAGEAFSKSIELMKLGFTGLQGPIGGAVNSLKLFAAELTVTNLASKAQAMTGAVTGAFAGMGPAIMNAVRGIGPAIAGAFTGLIPMVTGALAGLGPAITGVFASITAAIGGFSFSGMIASITGAVGSAVSALGGFAAAAGPIGLVIAGVVAAIAGIAAVAITVAKNWENIKLVLIGVWNDLGRAAENIGKQIALIFDATLGSGFAKSVGSIWQSIGTFFANIWNGIIATMQGALRKILEMAEAGARSIGATSTAAALDTWLKKLDGISTTTANVASKFTFLANETITASAAQAKHFQAVSTHGTVVAKVAEMSAKEAAKLAKELERTETHTRKFQFAMDRAAADTEKTAAQAEKLREKLAAIETKNAFAALQISLKNFRNDAMLASTEVPSYIKIINDATLTNVDAWEDVCDEIGKVKPIVEQTGGSVSRMGQEVGRVFSNFKDDLADSILKWDGFGAAGRRALESLKQSIVRNLLDEGLTPVFGVLGKLEGAFGQLASKISGLFGGSTQVPTPGVPGGPGGPNPVSNITNALTGVTSIVNVVTGAVSALTGVMSYLQGRRMEQDIGRIEVTIRGVLNQLVSIQGTMNQYLPWLENTKELMRLETIERALFEFAGGGWGEALANAISTLGQALAGGLQKGFQATIDTLGTFMRSMIAHFLVVENVLTALYNVTAKPEFRMQLPSTQQAPGAPGSPITTQSTNNRTNQTSVTVQVQNHNQNPYTTGLQIGAGLTATLGARA